MTLNGAIKQLHELRSAEDMPIYYKPVIAEVISVLLMDTQEVRNGKWIHYAHREPQYDISGVKTWGEAYQCSNCGFIHSVIEDFGHYAYCPSCGARIVAIEWDKREVSDFSTCPTAQNTNLEDDDSPCRDCEVEG